MRMQVILDSSFARPGSAPIWGGKKGEFRDWTMFPTVFKTFKTRYTHNTKNNNNDDDNDNIYVKYI